MSKKIHKAAIEYVKLGWFVFPLHSIHKDGSCTCGVPKCGDAGKHPRVKRGLKEASRDLDKVDEWFGKDALPSNIAIATGVKSGISVIDIDIGEGKLGADSWATAIKDHGEPQTLIATTGSGGMHVIFKYNSVLKTSSNFLGKGVDCRNDGGYIVAAPSKHKSGGVYEWVNQGTELADLPSHLSKRKETRGRPKKDDMYRSKYSIEQVEKMLSYIPSDDRDTWRHFGIILGRVFDCIDKAYEVYTNWAEKDLGKKGRGHDGIMHQAFYELSKETSENQLGIGTIVKAALDNGWAPEQGEVPIGNFLYFAPGNNFIYRPTTSYWIRTAVDAAVSPVNEDAKLTKASDWLMLNMLVTSMTCDPSVDEDYIKGSDCRDGEVILQDGAAMFNSYRRATIELGDSKLAKPFLKHVQLMLNKKGDAEQFLNYMAHRVQNPAEKPRFSLLISGGQGVGKDTAIEFCVPAIGAWNFANISPSALDSGFNEFATATVIRINEAANLQEMTKWAFNESTKVLIAGSPDICQINPKYGQKYSVKMHCGVIITTNHLADGIYIPQDDRRYDVIDSATLEEMGLADDKVRREYFTDLWQWFLQEDGGSHVAAYLHEKDISKFSAANGQRKTEAHQTIVAGGMSGDEWLDDILNDMDYPQAVRSDWIIEKALAAGEKDGNVRKKMSHAIGRLGYTLYKSPNKDGRWKIGGKKVTVYAKAGLPKGYDPTNELNKEPF